MFLKGGRRVIQAYTPGCLCWIDGRVPSKYKKLQWQNGFALVDYDEEEYYSINSVLIEEGKAVYDRRLYTARDRSEDLKGAYA